MAKGGDRRKKDEWRNVTKEEYFWRGSDGRRGEGMRLRRRKEKRSGEWNGHVGRSGGRKVNGRTWGGRVLGGRI